MEIFVREQALNPRIALFAPLAAFVVASVTPSPSAEAATGLRAQVLLTQRGIPRSLSEAGVLRFAKQHKTTRLMEDREPPIKERYWFANMVVNFNAPIGDSEFEVLFYDTQTSERKFIAPAMTVFVNDRNQKTIVHKLRLKRPQFEPNRRMEMVLTVRRQEVGRYRFQILGEEVQRSGEVSFSEDEV